MVYTYMARWIERDVEGKIVVEELETAFGFGSFMAV
tara:strand:+ start:364 stop:471 length:108 start_codon:yes stop_codon:yes gene_type:complete